MLRSARPVGRTLRILATNTFAAAVYALLLGSLVGWRSMLTYFLISFLYASVIGTAANLIMPLVGARLSGGAPVSYWLGLAGTLLGLTLVGSIVAGLLAAALGLFGPGSTWAAQRAGIGIALVLAMTVGMGVAVYESMRHRLDAARESLRARELEIERAHRLASDARLASLESRLHPHFLFNALAAIAGQVRESPERAERLLIEFADLLRASLDATKRHTVPLGDEITVVQSYLEIEHARLGERLRAKLDVPEDLKAWPVPPLGRFTPSYRTASSTWPPRAGGRRDPRRGAPRRRSSGAQRVGRRLRSSRSARRRPGTGSRRSVRVSACLFGPAASLEAARADGGARVTHVGAGPRRDRRALMTGRLRAYVVDDEAGRLEAGRAEPEVDGRVDVIGTATSGGDGAHRNSRARQSRRSSSTSTCPG